MISRLLRSKKITELLEAKKIDNSVINAIKENEKSYDELKKQIKKLEDSADLILEKINRKKYERARAGIFKIKDQIEYTKEIMDLKNDYQAKLEEIDEIEQECSNKEEICMELKAEIEEQYTAYQENEILIKTVEKIELRGIDLSSQFYKKYIKHVNTYLNSVYSIEKKTKIPVPEVKDLAFLLGVLKRNDELHNKSNNVDIKEENSKKSTNKKITKKVTNAKKVVQEIAAGNTSKTNNETNKNISNEVNTVISSNHAVS